MELLPTEVLFGIVRYLSNWEVKQLSLSSRRMRDVCLPFLFHNLTIEFSNKGFDLLESILKSNLHRYIVSLEYVGPMLLKPRKDPFPNHPRKSLTTNLEIRNYRYFKTQFLTPDEYVDRCEEYDDVLDREDWEGPEYLSDDHPSYTSVYKTLRRTCVEQQVIIKTGRASTLMSLAFKLLYNLKELILVFCETLSDEDWERDYQQAYDMTQQTSYEHHIQLVLVALKGRSTPLKVIQLTCLEPPNDLPSGSWDSLTIPLTELVGHALGLRLVESGLPLALLCPITLNIRELALSIRSCPS